MIQKLASGECRLYSLKKNPKTGKRRNLGTFKARYCAGIIPMPSAVRERRVTLALKNMLLETMPV